MVRGRAIVEVLLALSKGEAESCAPGQDEEGTSAKQSS